MEQWEENLIIFCLTATLSAWLFNFNLYIGGADMNITPAWQNAVRVYRIVIENPEISAEIKAEAWADLARLAREMDRENGGDHHDH